MDLVPTFADNFTFTVSKFNPEKANFTMTAGNEITNGTSRCAKTSRTVHSVQMLLVESCSSESESSRSARPRLSRATRSKTSLESIELTNKLAEPDVADRSTRAHWMAHIPVPEWY